MTARLLVIAIRILVWVASSGRIVVSGFAAFASPVGFLAVAALGGVAVRARDGAAAPPQTPLRRLELRGLNPAALVYMAARSCAFY